jgi:hypothetical protein
MNMDQNSYESPANELSPTRTPLAIRKRSLGLTALLVGATLTVVGAAVFIAAVYYSVESGLFAEQYADVNHNHDSPLFNFILIASLASVAIGIPMASVGGIILFIRLLQRRNGIDVD